MKQSARNKSEYYNDFVEPMEWSPSSSDRAAFVDEAIRIRKDGGVKHSGNYNKINSPGEKLLKEKENGIESNRQ